MNYLDWDKAENERVEQNVRKETAEQPFSGRRGMQDILDAAGRDDILQGGGRSPRAPRAGQLKVANSQ